MVVLWSKFRTHQSKDQKKNLCQKTNQEAFALKLWTENQNLSSQILLCVVWSCFFSNVLFHGALSPSSRHPHYFPSSSPHFSHKNQPLLSSMTTDQKVDLSFVSSHLHDSHTWIKSWYNKNFWPVFGPVFTPIPSLTYILLALIHFTSRPFTKRWLLWLNGLIGSNGRWHRAQRGN